MPSSTTATRIGCCRRSRNGEYGWGYLLLMRPFAPRMVVRLSVAMYVTRQGRSLQLQNTVFGVTNMDFPVGFRRTPITTMPSFPNATPQPRRVLVTGGAGFIGSHLCERLLEIGCDLLCVDNFFTGTRRNIEHLLDHPRFEILRHDITFPLYVEVDEIYNLACPASPVHYQWDPVQTTKTSVLGAINMLGLAKRLRGKILQASTSEVYGDPEIHPQQESYWGHVNPIGPRSCYDEGKRCAETLFFDYGRQHKLKIKVLRIFNTYGPRMQPNDGRVVSNFIVQALNNQDITIYGDGLQTRSFCFVDDLVSGNDRSDEYPRQDYRTYELRKSE